MFCGKVRPLVLAGVLAAGPASAGPLVEIGRTVQIRNAVVAEYETDRRRLDRGDRVHQNEIVETSRASQAEIRLNDETKLAVGPDSRMVLDTFVYDARANPGKTAVTMAKGAFRFISGNNPSSTYQIVTPAAAIGVRGTVFDLWVNSYGDTLALLHNGALDVCPTPTNCVLFDIVGGMIHISSQGVISYPRRWENRAMRDTPVQTAFPFVGRPLAIDPTPRMRYAVLMRELPIPRGGNIYTGYPQRDKGGRYPGDAPTKTGYPGPGTNTKGGSIPGDGKGTKGSSGTYGSKGTGGNTNVRSGNVKTTTKTVHKTTIKKKTTIQKTPQVTFKPKYNKQIFFKRQPQQKTIIK